uniref:DNA-(apurinic or apyrimidinic site) endonuclease 2 n=1 Tax=Knoxdaviesia capensis TaxID=114771 RepID=A0A1J0CYD7_9PEZI|nr:putative DNA lyase [Knoxdaviesia capensis]
MQETKIQRKDLNDEMVMIPNWDVFLSLPVHKKGYSGVAIFTRKSSCCPIRAEEGITGVLTSPTQSVKYRDLPPSEQIGGYPRPGQLLGTYDDATLDSEGRCVIVEFPAFVLLGVYSPAMRDETRVNFRTDFFHAIDVRVRNLVAEGKQVILTGDLNVTPAIIDSGPHREAMLKGEVTMDDFLDSQCRRIFNQLVDGGKFRGARDEGRDAPLLWDLCRYFNPEREGMYTCWDTRTNARPANFGSRIDFILCTDGLRDWVRHANIMEHLLGSDHCPVYADFNKILPSRVTRFSQLPEHAQSDTVGNSYMLDFMNPAGVYAQGTRLRDWAASDLLPQSAQMMPEFRGRQSIRNMFMRLRAVNPTGESKSVDAASSETPPTATSSQSSLPLSSTHDSPVKSSVSNSSKTMRRLPPVPQPVVLVQAAESAQREAMMWLESPSPLSLSGTGGEDGLPKASQDYMLSAPESADTRFPSPAKRREPSVPSTTSTSLMPPTKKSKASGPSRKPAAKPSLGKPAASTPSTATASKKTKDGLAQSSLRGFFHPKPSPAPPPPPPPSQTTTTSSSSSSSGNIAPAHASRGARGPDESGAGVTPSLAHHTSRGLPDAQPGSGTAGAPPPPIDAVSPRPATKTSGRGAGDNDGGVDGDGSVYDPIEVKESWTTLLTAKLPPLCEHEERCIMLQTKKPGINRGRMFYICPRPLGPSGEKEKGTEWRCSKFVWKSDWDGQKI